MLKPGDQIGHYNIQERIEGGNMGMVYRAQDTRNQQEVAIKVISCRDDQTIPEKVVEDFQREAQMIAQLNHPRILLLLRDDQGVSIRYDSNKGIYYMVMPYCQEKDLNFWLRKDAKQPGWLPLEGVAHFVHQAAQALQHIHNNNIVHRDVKPSNFLIQSHKENVAPLYPDICLADFGIARLTTTDMTAIVIGTSKYMAPEQWENRPELIGPHTDQYALGIMAYELLTGYCPFVGTPLELRQQHCKDSPQPPSKQKSGIPAEIDRVIIRALEKDPQKRFPSVSAFDQEFQKAVSILTQPPPVPPPGPPPNGDEKRKSKSKWLFASVIALIILVLVFVGCMRILPQPLPISTKVIELAVDLPLSGEEWQHGVPVKNGVQLAITKRGSISGYTLKLKQSDHVRGTVHDSSAGANNVKTLKSDAQVAGIIGPYHSDVAVQEIPVAANNGPIALISPSNTSDCLTANPCGGPSQDLLLNDSKRAYFRTAALDPDQASRLANYLFNTQHYRTASIFEEQPNLYGQRFAESFYGEWQRLGGKVIDGPLGPDGKVINGRPIIVSSSAGGAGYSARLQPLVANPPELVFFGGDTRGAMLLHGLMKLSKGLAMTPFASGAGIMAEPSANLRSSPGDLVYAIVPVGDPVGDPSQAPAGLDFLQSYNHSYPPGTLSPYSASSYDCANILIQAIENALKAGVTPPLNKDDQATAKKFRQRVIDELHRPSFSYTGVTGVYSFNGNADPTNPSVSIYRLGETINPATPTHQFSDNRWQLMQMETRGKDGWQLKYSSN